MIGRTHCQPHGPTVLRIDSQGALGLKGLQAL